MSKIIRIDKCWSQEMIHCPYCIEVTQGLWSWYECDHDEGPKDERIIPGTIHPKCPLEDAPKEEGRFTQSDDLQCWFNLSYASFLTLPRVFMEAMPVEWQDRIAALLKEYEAAFPNQPDIGTRIQITQNGKLIKTPEWLINYRHPDREMIQKLRGEKRP